VARGRRGGNLGGAVQDYLSRYILRGYEPLRATDTVAEGARRLSTDRLTDLPVVAADGTICGLFGEKELIAALCPGYLAGLRDTSFIARDFEDVADEAAKVMERPVSDFMRDEYATLDPDFSVLHAAELFLHRRQGVIPLVEAGRPVGLLRRADLGRAIIEGARARRDGARVSDDFSRM
jgi:CBS domain-containing protein